MKLHHRVWFVLSMLFLVLGPLGIPLLWRSPAFSRKAKWILTVGVILYTVFLLGFSVVVFQSMLNQMRQFSDGLR